MRGEPISKFFESLGFPLHNARWSWGAESETRGILLRTWGDQFETRPHRRVLVARPSWARRSRTSAGYPERIEHLRTLWTGGVPAYTVIAEAVDADSDERTIKTFRDDGVFVIDRLEHGAGGAVWALLTDFVKREQLESHIGSHLVHGHSTSFPVELEHPGHTPAQAREKNGTDRAGPLSSETAQGTAALLQRLIELARIKGRTHYGELMKHYGVGNYVLQNWLGVIGKGCVARGEPVLTALVVQQATGHCGPGFAATFGIADDEAERQRCYAFWFAPATQAAADSFEARAERFVQAAVRPAQAAFRRAVFEACGGKCVITGCDIPEALEAAHLDGRDWRAGHNTATDGVLLRRDVHALYDAALLKFLATGEVWLADKVLGHYADLAGVVANVRRSG